MRCGIVSFRLGLTDGVSIEAAKWGWALQSLGFSLRTVAGEGPVDVTIPGLAIAATSAPTLSQLGAALDDCDLVVVENLCSLPLNPEASDLLARYLAGRPAILHHHDLPWQRHHLAHFPPPPDDPAWRHVTINELSRSELAQRKIVATTCYNTFDPNPPPGRRIETRNALGIKKGERVILQPTRAIARKNIQAGVDLATAWGATYWLMGPAEDGFGPELDAVLSNAKCRIIRGFEMKGGTIHDAYSACDLVALPSSWEGFGNPTLESATHRRPLAVGRYPVAQELRSFGFTWFDAFNPEETVSRLNTVDITLLEHNHEIARRHFNLNDLPERIAALLPSQIRYSIN